MSSSPLNPSQHVERIREILIGRDLQHMHGRISRIEGSLEKNPAVGTTSNIEETLTQLQNEQVALRQELQLLKSSSHSHDPRHSNLGGRKSTNAPIPPETASQIDARFREILSHFQNELLKFKGQLDENLRSLESEKASRSELKSRFARLASAAMEEQDSDAETKIEGFLL